MVLSLPDPVAAAAGAVAAVLDADAVAVAAVLDAHVAAAVVDARVAAAVVVHAHVAAAVVAAGSGSPLALPALHSEPASQSPPVQTL